MTYEGMPRHDAGNGNGYMVTGEPGNYRVVPTETDGSGKTTVTGSGEGPFETLEEANKVAEQKAKTERESAPETE